MVTKTKRAEPYSVVVLVAVNATPVIISKLALALALALAFIIGGCKDVTTSVENGWKWRVRLRG